MKSIVISFFVACGLVACSSTTTNEGAPTTNGVDDVAKACQIKAVWTKTSSTDCINCKSYASVARCACADVDYAGQCSGQFSTFSGEPTCAGVDDCVKACAVTDCDCQTKCYDAKPACKAAGDARDGCLAAACDSHCK